MNGRIVKWARYGEHIPLTCSNHPELRWSTKNISPIGARSIFYNLNHVEGMRPECNCPASDLISLSQKQAKKEGYEFDADREK